MLNDVRQAKVHDILRRAFAYVSEFWSSCFITVIAGYFQD